tara:strand:+ start:113 stop:529 length:417 start_codon:yes stop_codon:yes gene_type:complete
MQWELPWVLEAWAKELWVKLWMELWVKLWAEPWEELWEPQWLEDQQDLEWDRAWMVLWVIQVEPWVVLWAIQVEPWAAWALWAAWVMLLEERLVDLMEDQVELLVMQWEDQMDQETLDNQVNQEDQDQTLVVINHKNK